MKKLVVATRNENKVIEIKEMLKDLPLEVVSADDMGVDTDVVEDGNTFEENAYKKAYQIMKITGEPVLADDSGLEVDALGGRPGGYSARFAGVHGDYRRNNEKLLQLMRGVPDEKRGARFVTVMVLLYPDMRKKVTRGEIRGYITTEPRGTAGFGYDPLFLVPEYNRTFAELGAKIKNGISHRAKALSGMRDIIAEGKAWGSAR
mgnify:CR=1 FL=1